MEMVNMEEEEQTTMLFQFRHTEAPCIILEEYKCPNCGKEKVINEGQEIPICSCKNDKD